MKVFLFIFIFIILLSGIEPISVLNNETVPNDILIERFYNEIQSKNIFSDKSFREAVASGYDTKKCILSLQEILKQFPSLKVVPFFDSWGKLPSGILYGNVYDVGNFDQCVTTSVHLNDLIGDVSGQFCFAKIPLQNQNLQKQSLRYFTEEQNLMTRSSDNSLAIRIGICVPDSCSPQILEYIFQQSLQNVFNGRISGVKVVSCTDGKIPPLRTINIIGIAVFSMFGLLMLLSTIYDFLTTYFKKSPKNILLAFSIIANGRKLFAVNTKKSPNTIDCLTGIRVFSMAWVIYCHSFLPLQTFPIINGIETLSWINSFASMHVRMGTVSVDSFFFISGVLVAWVGFKELDRTKGQINIIMMYVHRYIRLTPLVGAVLLYTFSLNEQMYNGPFRHAILASENCNGYTWWPIILYIQNYFNPEANCFAQAWYLAVDFQLYILSPLLLIPMWKWGKRFLPVLLLLSLLSIGCVMTIFIVNGFTDLNGGNKNELNIIYFPTHTRCSPWLVGFGLGYFMHVNRQTSFRPSKIVQLLGWICSLATLLLIVFGPYFTMHAHGVGTVFEAAMYAGWKQFSWAVAMAWITFACHFGFGGIVNSILSHPFWQPLGRLTFSLYLVHLFVVRMNFGIMRTEVYFSNYNQVLCFWGVFGISLIFAIFASLAFESPILILENNNKSIFYIFLNDFLSL